MEKFGNFMQRFGNAEKGVPPEVTMRGQETYNVAAQAGVDTLRDVSEVVHEFAGTEETTGQLVDQEAIANAAKALALVSVLSITTPVDKAHADEIGELLVRLSQQESMNKGPSLEDKQKLFTILRSYERMEFPTQEGREGIKSEVHNFMPEDMEGMSAEDKKCLVDNVYHEARGEIKNGWAAVAFATLSRVIDRRYPNNVCGVVHQPWQFSWTMDKNILKQPIRKAMYKRIANEMKRILDGKKKLEEMTEVLEAETNLPEGAIFYKRVGFKGSPRVQRFFGKLKSVGVVGRHEFFVEVKK